MFPGEKNNVQETGGSSHNFATNLLEDYGQVTQSPWIYFLLLK